jgi:hypothetical protein
MKKLLSLLGAVGLIATSSATVVACGDPDKGTANTDEKDYSDPITYTIDDLLGQFSTKDDDGTYIMNDAVKQWSTDDDWDGAIAVLSIDLLVGLTYNGRDRITETIEDMAISVQPVDSNLPKIDNPDKPDKPKSRNRRWRNLYFNLFNGWRFHWWRYKCNCNKSWFHNPSSV